MGINGVGGSPSLNSGMVGVGIKTLNAAHETQADAVEKILPSQSAGSTARVASEAKGLFVDTYA